MRCHPPPPYPFLTWHTSWSLLKYTLLRQNLETTSSPLALWSYVFYSLWYSNMETKSPSHCRCSTCELLWPVP